MRVVLDDQTIIESSTSSRQPLEPRQSDLAKPYGRHAEQLYQPSGWCLEKSLMEATDSSQDIYSLLLKSCRLWRALEVTPFAMLPLPP